MKETGTSVILGELEIPVEAHTLDGFRRWYASIAGTPHPKVAFVRGRLYVDMAAQSYRSHLPITAEINGVLSALAKARDLGNYFGDGAWLTNEAADLSSEPDGMLVLWETWRTGEARLREGTDIELVGRADMVLEVVSRTSVRKDTVDLVEQYARARIPEYWLVDARAEDAIRFEVRILRDAAYEIVAFDEQGWVYSPTWGRAFRLRREPKPVGQPFFHLEMRDDA